MTDNRYRIAIKPGLALGMLFCLMIFMLVVASLISELLLSSMGSSPSSLRLQAIIQDLLVFILPPIVTAMITTRYPAELLEIMRGPRLAMILWAVVALVGSIPAMNVVIAWNDGWTLPDSMRWVRELEESARLTTEVMMQGTSVWSLIVSVLIVGVLTGVAEELFFRGGVQKLLMCTRINPHIAIWLAALIFSTMHLQVYGFVPRLLLGAFFGYAMYWSGSLWLPIILHALNNSLVVVTAWMAARGAVAQTTDLDHLGLGYEQMPLIIGSAALAAVAIYFMKHTSHKCCK